MVERGILTNPLSSSPGQSFMAKMHSNFVYLYVNKYIDHTCQLLLNWGIQGKGYLKHLFSYGIFFFRSTFWREVKKMLWKKKYFHHRKMSAQFAHQHSTFSRIKHLNFILLPKTKCICWRNWHADFCLWRVFLLQKWGLYIAKWIHKKTVQIGVSILSIPLILGIKSFWENNKKMGKDFTV